MTAAYYNEHDAFAAAWLRELIKAGLIAPGDVDERSIEDVLPNELAGYTQCHFFAGIGVWSYALRRAGWPDDRPVWTGSCPCQPFSAAGKGDGFADERHLWPAFYNLIRQRRPDIVFGEQVASKDADTWIDLVHTDMEALGYAFGAIPFPAAGVGAPNIRDRLYWVADSQGDGHKWRGKLIEPAGRPGAAHGSAIIGMADSMPTGRPERRAESGNGSIAGRSVVGGLGEPDSAGRISGREGIQTARHGGATESAGCDGRLVHPLIEGLEGQPRNGDDRDEPGRIGAEPSGSTAEDGGACGVGDAIDSGRQLEPNGERSDGKGVVSGWREQVKSGENVRNTDATPATGPTNGFWRAADWLGCRDGKWRPVEPGTFPLAHGAAARVGRLRGYGNAINAEAAKSVIEAYLIHAAGRYAGPGELCRHDDQKRPAKKCLTPRE